MRKKTYGRYQSSPRRKNRFRSKGNSIDISKYINKNPEDAGDQSYSPSMKISDLQVSEKLMTNILKKRFAELTPIQDKSIPLIFEGRDLIGVADTGTGKTAAFLIPMINKAAADKSQKVLIIAPTRELAQQINTEFESFAQGLNLYSTLCIGGTSMYAQRKDLNRPHDFLVCTPGRIKDLAKRNWVNLSLYNNIIIDEVDRMFDMGFQKDIQIILGLLPKNRQTLFFSATVSGKIEELMNQYINNPERISIDQKKSYTNIKQDIVRTNSSEKKIDVLHDMLIKPEFTKVIVFIQTKWRLKDTEKELRFRGFKVASIHGNKTQAARQKSLSQFKENRINILLATDVAARGLDIDNVSHVINYDQPATYDDYIHRIGRTGRGNNKGTALTFV